MTPTEFVDLVRSSVQDEAVKGSISLVEKPPGRRPDADLVALSSWYNALDAAGKAMARRLCSLTARGAVFGFLTLLDGSRIVRLSDDDDAHFELRFVDQAESTQLAAGLDGPALHELL